MESARPGLGPPPQQPHRRRLAADDVTTADVGTGGRPTWARHHVADLSAGTAYVALGALAWWHLLAAGLSRALPTGSSDPGAEVWYLAWTAHALGHGQNPFLSHALYWPSGVNLLVNASDEALGLLLWPVTALFGPIASFGVAVIAAPAVSAIGAYVLVVRHVSWRPSAFLAGLVYGFGPFLATDLRFGHLNLTWLPIPPLVLACLDRLLFGRTRHPLRVGALLGGLVVVQFFLSTEILALTAMAVAGVAALLASFRPRQLAHAVARAWAGLATAAGLAVAVLAYPMWMVVAGPRHIVGPVWPTVPSLAATVASLVVPGAELPGVAFISGGNGDYVGAGLLLVAMAGTVVWWRVLAVRVAALGALAAEVLALGYRLHVTQRGTPVPLPGALLGHVPLLDSVILSRCAVFVDLGLAVVLAVVVDRLWRGDVGRAGPAAAVATGTTWTPRRRRWAVLAALAAFVALAPLAMLPGWPYPVARLPEPAALRPQALAAAGLAPVGPHGAVPVVAVYPATTDGQVETMVWQASDGFPFALPDGNVIVPGAGGHGTSSPPANAFWEVLAAGTLGTLRPRATTSEIRAVRTALRHLGVDAVLVLPGAHSALVAAVLGQVLGRPTTLAGGARVWYSGSNAADTADFGR